MGRHCVVTLLKKERETKVIVEWRTQNRTTMQMKMYRRWKKTEENVGVWYIHKLFMVFNLLTFQPNWINKGARAYNGAIDICNGKCGEKYLYLLPSCGINMRIGMCFIHVSKKLSVFSLLWKWFTCNKKELLCDLECAS